MRDFHDAKVMAQTLRESLSNKAITISHSDSLELVSKMFGVTDWNTLSARIQAKQEEASGLSRPRRDARGNYPAIPIRDFVPFPESQFPLFVGREKTKLALDEAFTRQREIVLIVQKDPAMEEPGPRDIYDIGVLARLLDLEHLPEGSIVKGRPMPGGTMKVLLQAYRRVEILNFVCEAGAFEVEFANINESRIPDAPQLIQKAIDLFDSYLARHEINPPITPSLDQMRDPGRVADVIASHVTLPIPDKQILLSTFDPITRLERVARFIEQRP
jgi:ATP-dependent Lon protease